MRAFVVSGLLILAACGGELPDDPPPPPIGEGLLAVGTGPDDGSPGFIEVVDGQELTLIPGAQGGFHVHINVRLDEEGIQRVGDAPMVERLARREADGELVSRGLPRKVDLVPTDQGQYESEGSMLLFLCPTPVGLQVADETIILNVTATSKDAADTVEGTIRFVPVCPQDDQKDFCERICFG